MKRVLYIYDHPEWAIHNVGKMWDNQLNTSFLFDFIAVKDIRTLDPTKSPAYDVIFWGYGMMLSCRHFWNYYRLRKKLSILMKITHSKTLQELKAKSVTIIHDPIELFPTLRGGYDPKKTQKDESLFKNWQKSRADLGYLKWLGHYCVTSNEMQLLLKKHGKEVDIIPTYSDIPVIQESELGVDQSPKIMSRASPQMRKNIPLLMYCKNKMMVKTPQFDLYLDKEILSRDAYIERLKAHNTYICTSWCEGGPLPLMDALNCGHIIITTPVGQTDELVVHGKNGFFCKTEAEFIQALNWLVEHPKAIIPMRKASLEIASNRLNTKEKTKELMLDFISKAIEPT